MQLQLQPPEASTETTTFIKQKHIQGGPFPPFSVIVLTGFLARSHVVLGSERTALPRMRSAERMPGWPPVAPVSPPSGPPLGGACVALQSLSFPSTQQLIKMGFSMYRLCWCLRNGFSSRGHEWIENIVCANFYDHIRHVRI